MQEVFEKIIEKLEEEADSANDKIMEQETEKDMAYYDGYDDGCSKAIEIVKQEAEKYNNGWISCSERLPDSSCDVIITTRSLLNGVGSYFGKDRRWIQWYSGGGISVDVIAWQPLPEPYQQKS